MACILDCSVFTCPADALDAQTQRGLCPPMSCWLVRH
jgi:hypothetical protein